MAEQPQHDAKTMADYKTVAEGCAEKIKNRNGWLVEWFPEQMPLENKHSTCMNPLLNSFAFPPQPYEDNPQSANAPALSVLVFADSFGFAKDMLRFAPQDRVGRRQFVTTAPAQLTQKKVESIISEGWDMLLFASGIDEPKNSTSEEIHKTQQDVCNLLLMISKVLSDNKTHVQQICVVTADAFAEEREIHEQCGVGLITNCTLFGFVNTARLELDIPIQYIDTEWSLPETMMPLLSSEMFRKQTFGRNTVRIVKSGRYVLRQVNPVPTYTKESKECDLPTEAGHIIAISGGNGGVAIVIGTWIVRQLGLRGIKGIKLMFLSRSMKISDANLPFWEKCQKLAEEVGVEVEQARGDVSNKASVDAWVAERATTLAGFVHSAGVLADTLLFKIKWEDFDTVWNPKSRAAMWLHEAFEKHGCPIKLFWMFSSTSVYGNMGQLNYSASNAFMDGLARHRRALGKAALVLAWGPWGEVGMATTLDENSKRRMMNSPMPYFSNAEGLDGLETVIRTGAAYGQVYKVNPEMFIGMVNMPQNSHVGQFQANFYRAVAPPLPTLNMSPDNSYAIYQSMTGKSGYRNVENTCKEGLIYKHYVKQRVCDDDEDD